MTKLLNHKDSMMNDVINTLIQYEFTKTGYHSLFTCIKDFGIDELEMLEFLFENCPETVKTLEQECEKYQQEFKKPSSVSWLLMQTTFTLKRTYDYDFGWLKNKKVDALDTITDILEIHMKERHIKYLSQLRELRTDIDATFIEAFNQTQPLLNPFRIEQTLFYLRESLEYEGIKTSYSDFVQAVPFTFTGDWKPYFCKSNFGYYIVDNNGHYSGDIFMIHKDLDRNQPLQWWYTSSIAPESWHMDKALAKVKVEKLRELRGLAEFKNLDWKVIYANKNDMRENNPFRGLSYEQNLLAKKHEIIETDIPKGCIGKQCQAAKEIEKKYKPIINQVNLDFRKSPVGMAR